MEEKGGHNRTKNASNQGICLVYYVLVFRDLAYRCR
jgi:hypothetical protein